MHSDQLSSPHPGIVLQSPSKLTTKSCNCITIYVESSSDCAHCDFQTLKEATETVTRKRKFKNVWKTDRVDTQACRSENQIHNSNIIHQICNAAEKGLTFSGVKDQHQKGVAERKIGWIAKLSRTMMFHVMTSWPSRVSTLLWHFVIKSSIYLHKATPKNSDLSPEEFLSGYKPSFDFSKFPTLGCPNCNLEPTLQSGQKIPKWKPQSKLGVCLGKISEHSGRVSLILDPLVIFSSPQFNSAYEYDFTFALWKRVDITWPTWNQLFQRCDKFPGRKLMSTPLVATITNEGDSKSLRVEARIDDKQLID